MIRGKLYLRGANGRYRWINAQWNPPAEAPAVPLLSAPMRASLPTDPKATPDLVQCHKEMSFYKWLAVLGWSQESLTRKDVSEYSAGATGLMKVPVCFWDLQGRACCWYSDYNGGEDIRQFLNESWRLGNVVNRLVVEQYRGRQHAGEEIHLTATMTILRNYRDNVWIFRIEQV